MLGESDLPNRALFGDGRQKVLAALFRDGWQGFCAVCGTSMNHEDFERQEAIAAVLGPIVVVAHARHFHNQATWGLATRRFNVQVAAATRALEKIARKHRRRPTRLETDRHAPGDGTDA